MRAPGRYGSSSRLLGEIEIAVLLVERELAPILAARGGEPLGSCHAIAKALCRAAQLELGIDVDPPRDVDGSEEHVAELGRVEILLQLAQLVLEIGDGADRVRILEADGLRALLDLARVQQRGQRLGNVVEDRPRALRPRA